MFQHIFIIMPFGKREGIDFDKIYQYLMKPSLKGAGFEVIRADQELVANDVHMDGIPIPYRQAYIFPCGAMV